jgi:glycosyltransferase involved in cell wall biosynthesis
LYRPTSFSDLTVVFPLWNEEAYVARAVAGAIEACEALVSDAEIGDYDIVLVDDASTDRTAEIADALSRSNRRVRVIHHEQNGKLGRALRTGFAHARGELVLYADADLPFDFREISKAVRLLRVHRADIVSAYRHNRGDEGHRRSVYSVVYNLLIRSAFGTQLRDVNFAFKLFRRSVLSSIHLRSEGSFVSAELLVSAARLGLTTVQFGVDYFPRRHGTSTLSSPTVIAKMLVELAQCRPAILRLSAAQRAPVTAHDSELRHIASEEHAPSLPSLQ